MKSLGLEPREIRATGGGAKSGTWLQITADILGTPVITLEEDEAAALGAAVQAIWCHHNHLGHRIPLSEITDSMIKTAGRTYLPDGGNAGIYAALQDRFNSLWETLSDEFKRHRNLMRPL
jgi:xylulokinase